jgi:hypothetical protein
LFSIFQLVSLGAWANRDRGAGGNQRNAQILPKNLGRGCGRSCGCGRSRGCGGGGGCLLEGRCSGLRNLLRGGGRRGLSHRSRVLVLRRREGGCGGARRPRRVDPKEEKEDDAHDDNEHREGCHRRIELLQQPSCLGTASFIRPRDSEKGYRRSQSVACEDMLAWQDFREHLF